MTAESMPLEGTRERVGDCQGRDRELRRTLQDDSGCCSDQTALRNIPDKLMMERP